MLTERQAMLLGLHIRQIPDEEQGFMQAIMDDQEDMTHRLIYADWIEENCPAKSDQSRAEFIRLSIDQYNCTHHDRCQRCSKVDIMHQIHLTTLGRFEQAEQRRWRELPCTCKASYKARFHRLSRMLEDHKREWSEVYGREFCWRYERDVDEYTETVGGTGIITNRKKEFVDCLHPGYSRGLIEVVACDRVNDWMLFGWGAVAFHPIKRVVVSDIVPVRHSPVNPDPYRIGRARRYFRYEIVPEQLAHLMVYPHAEGAETPLHASMVLSAALIAYAKSNLRRLLEHAEDQRRVGGLGRVDETTAPVKSTTISRLDG